MSDFESFARLWCEQQGLFQTLYGPMLGEDILTVIRLIDSQGHSGMSNSVLFAALVGINNDYCNSASPIYQEWLAAHSED